MLTLERWRGLVFEEVDGYRPGPVFEWEEGELRAARLCFEVEEGGEEEERRGVPREGVEAMGAVLEHDLRELMVGIQRAGELEVTMQPIVDVIAAGTRSSLRSLSLLARPFDNPFTWDDERYADLGDLGGLWSKLPALERLVLHADRLQLGEVSLPQLRTLEIQFTLTHELGRHALTGACWPQLESVALHVGDTEFGSEATCNDLAGILEPLPRLRHLAIIGFNDDKSLIHWLSSSPLLPRLHTLSLPGSLESTTPEALATTPPFRHLNPTTATNIPDWRRRF